MQHSFSTGLGLVDAGIRVSAVLQLALAGRKDARLVSRPLGEPKLTRTLAVIRRRGVSLSPAAQEFLAMLRKRWGQVRRAPSWFDV